MARPTKWDPETMLPILERCAQEGMFRHQVAKELSIHIDTLIEWEKLGQVNEDFAPFSEALKRVDSETCAILEKVAIDGAIGKTDVPNPSLLIFTLKNKLGWRDRQEIEQTVSGKNPITINIGGVRPTEDDDTSDGQHNPS